MLHTLRHPAGTIARRSVKQDLYPQVVIGANSRSLPLVELKAAKTKADCAQYQDNKAVELAVACRNQLANVEKRAEGQLMKVEGKRKERQ